MLSQGDRNRGEVVGEGVEGAGTLSWGTYFGIHL